MTKFTACVKVFDVCNEGNETLQSVDFEESVVFFFFFFFFLVPALLSCLEREVSLFRTLYFMLAGTR
jgi:hypothetical protein